LDGGGTRREISYRRQEITGRLLGSGLAGDYHCLRSPERRWRLAPGAAREEPRPGRPALSRYQRQVQLSRESPVLETVVQYQRRCARLDGTAGHHHPITACQHRDLRVPEAVKRRLIYRVTAM
jgi:hypothetical protein